MTRCGVISEARGNLLQAEVDALVNTVNTVGVMGKGIALQFKRAFPVMYRDYLRAVTAGEIQLGCMHVWPTGQLSRPRYVINFPTKGHWRSPSRLADVERGLDDLVRVVQALDIGSIAVPPLGCGNGGLDWRVVEPLIRSKLEPVTGLEVHLYPPAGALAAADMVTAGAKPAMTGGRAALVALLARYRTYADDEPSLIETQKLMYFLQLAGEPLQLDFVAHHYGPYADNLRHVLKLVEGHFLSGFGDGSTLVQQAEPLVLMPDAEQSAEQVLARHPATQERIDRVLRLVEGFESAYALELLATVHWVTTHRELRHREEIVEAVRAWSPRKGRMFSPEHVRIALQALAGRGFLREALAPA